MIFCPYCGFSLPQKLKDGISSCDHCKRIFDSSSKNRVLSAAWFIRKRNSCDDISDHNFLTTSELDFVKSYVADKGYSHDDLLKILKSAPLMF